MCVVGGRPRTNNQNILSIGSTGSPQRGTLIIAPSIKYNMKKGISYELMLGC